MKIKQKEKSSWDTRGYFTQSDTKMFIDINKFKKHPNLMVDLITSNIVFFLEPRPNKKFVTFRYKPENIHFVVKASIVKCVGNNDNEFDFNEQTDKFSNLENLIVSTEANKVLTNFFNIFQDDVLNRILSHIDDLLKSPKYDFSHNITLDTNETVSTSVPFLLRKLSLTIQSILEQRNNKVHKKEWLIPIIVTGLLSVLSLIVSIIALTRK